VVNAVASQKDSKILVSGSNSPRLARFGPDGEPDPSLTPLNLGSEVFRVALQADR